MAHFNKLFLAIDLPTFTASLSLFALITSIVITFVAPSASFINNEAKSDIKSCNCFSKFSLSGFIPLAPEDIKITVSLVEVQPSESIRLRVLSVAD